VAFQYDLDVDLVAAEDKERVAAYWLAINTVCELISDQGEGVGFQSSKTPTPKHQSVEKSE
jgi:hypothetical protein